MKFFSHAEGYVDTENDNKYVYQYKDHLGNVRLSYLNIGTTGTPNLEIQEENNYYPFGLKHKGYNNGTGSYANIALKRKFGGNEIQEELSLGWYDITARNYDPALGRWMNLDPLAEQMRRHSPYNYAFDNPIYFIDPDGMMPFGTGTNPVLGEKRTTKVSGRQQTFHRLSKAAVTTLSEGTGINKEILEGVWVSVDQKVHDNSTGYKSGAITLGRYIFFTGNYENADTQSWLELLGHEVKHSEQAKRKGPSGYLPEYFFRIGTTAAKEGTTDEYEIHKKHPMEVSAENTENQFESFLDSFNYEDEDGNQQNSIIDIFNNDDLDDDQKSQLLLEMFKSKREKKYEDLDKS